MTELLLKNRDGEGKQKDEEISTYLAVQEANFFGFTLEPTASTTAFRSGKVPGSLSVAEEISEDFQHVHCLSERISHDPWCIHLKRRQ